MTCTHPLRMWEPLHRARQLGEEGPIRFAFGKVQVCPGCRRILGDVVLFKSTEPHVKAAVKAFSGTSWSAMLESHPWPPFSFELSGSGVLMPEGYTGEKKSQPDILDEENPPF